MSQNDMNGKSMQHINLWKHTKQVSEVIPDRDAVIWGEGRRSYSELMERSENIAKYLVHNKMGCFQERSDLRNHESGQDHVAIYLYNGPEYVETMLACFGSRTAPMNVNYRYVATELKYILEKSAAKVIVYDARFSKNLAEIRDELPDLKILIEVGGDGVCKLEGAISYEEILELSFTDTLLPNQQPEDLAIIFTGGTTGMPKAVMWQQADLWNVMIGSAHPVDGTKFSDLDELKEIAKKKSYRVMCIPPMMHLTGFSLVQMALSAGVTVVFPKHPEHLDPAAIWRAVEQEKVSLVCTIGNAMAEPLLRELERAESEKKAYDITSLFAFVNGGAAMGEKVRNTLLEKLPETAIITDGVGSTEGGKQLMTVFSRKKKSSVVIKYRANTNCRILSTDCSRVLNSEDKEEGWLASVGTLPLGYLNEENKSRETFPVIHGIRYSIPGDKAKYVDGQVVLLGRDSVTINSGGEKIFAEEVEMAILNHPDVKDVVVAGRPSERWGSEVVAIVSVNRPVDPKNILAACEMKIARYKLPKEIIFVEKIERGPNGKADYKWAKRIVQAANSEKQ